MASAPDVLHLGDQSAIMGLDRGGPAHQVVVTTVVPGDDAARRLMRRHPDRFGDDHRGAAAGAIGVIAEQALGHALADGVAQ